MAEPSPPPSSSSSPYDQLFDAVDRGGDGLLDFGDVVYMLKRLSPDQSLSSARNAAVEALLLIGRGEAAIAPPSAATSAARRLDRADFRLLLEKVAAMAGVDPTEAAEKLLAQARRASFSLSGGDRGGGDEDDDEDDAAVAREVAAVDRRDSVLLDEEVVAPGAATAGDDGDDNDDEDIRVLPSAEATAAAAAAVAASAAGADDGGGGVEGATTTAPGGNRSASSTSMRRKALALATDPQLGLLFNAWCNGGGGGGTGSSAGGAAPNDTNATTTPKALSLADVAQGLCRLRPPKTKEDVAATLAEAAHAVARHDADGDGLLARAEFASFVSALLSAAGVAFGDAAGALLEVAQARPASEAMRRTLEEHGERAARVLREERRRGTGGGE